jgi:hypothetical protein
MFDRFNSGVKTNRRPKYVSHVLAVLTMLLFVVTVSAGEATSHAAPDPVFAPPAGSLPKHWHESGGFGTDTKGGIGGEIYKVTNLNSSGLGSLPDAVSQSNRLVVFEVGGVIDMEGARLKIASDITIAGQAAPYPGISIIKSNVIAYGSNIVISHLNVHLGSKVGRHYDALNVRGSHIVLDHCAVYWGLDETLPIARSTDVTVYKCIVAEGLQFTGHGDGEHSKGLHIQKGNKKVSVIGSLGAHNALRNPRIDGGEAFLANYVLYNWGPGWDHRGPRPSSDDELPNLPQCYNYALHAHLNANVTLVGSVALSGYDSKAEYFISGHHDGKANAYLSDNMIKDRQGKDLKIADPNIKTLDAPAIWPEGMEPLPAEEALYQVLRTVGPQPGNRNLHNARLVQSVVDGTGEIIDSEDEVGGYPHYAATKRSLTVPDGAAARQAWLDALEDEIAVDRSMNLSRLYNIVGSRASDTYAY